ncbi:hypothetical protein DHEL01_v201288 [Diaporthe helianthi]|uniref:PD-(D/E)XK nuclease-like domain-containing protein n=1 Tax=Diaporthe helianthi TaxID=158607 RepID=A0A2P5ICS9_DIAHE|nr:hypothetical protein DHEL01_v201288 [Diaporthe helianthi]
MRSECDEDESDHARIISWLQCIEPSAAGDNLAVPPRTPCSKRRRQMPTPATSTSEMNEECGTTPPIKRRRPNEVENDVPDLDLDRTLRGRGNSAALSASDGLSSGSRSSATSTSRASPTKRLARLEIAPENPVLVTQISMNDDRIPAELRTLLGELDGFQARAGIVPGYLAADVQERARNDNNFYNIRPWMFEDDAASAGGPAPSPDPTLSLDQVLKVFESAKECLNEDHAEAAWNTLVHWPMFELALGLIAEVTVPSLTSPDRPQQARVRGMPCTAARLTGRSYGSKMVDYCVFVEPQPREAAKITEIRSKLTYINHTDYHALRQRPIVLSAESKKPGEGGRNAQLQLSVWQAAQWAVLENLVAAAAGDTAERPALIPFLPALIIQGHEWHFAATTRSGNTTVLWVRQPLGATDSILGIFQIVRVRFCG